MGEDSDNQRGISMAVTGPRVSDHELLRPIGGGAYGDVWLARSVLGELRAVKIIHRSRFHDARPFEREFEGIQHFEPISRSHPSQLAILHVGKNDAAGCFYYVMELADDATVAASVSSRADLSAGRTAIATPQKIPARILTDAATYSPRTLRHDLEQHTRLPIPDCIQIGLSLTTALAHLHQHGLVHRDIKPSNVIFVNGVPKLGDIGLVTEAGDTQSIVGTEGYLPPEGPGTPQADIFSLGKVLYEISTGLDRRRFAELPEDLRSWPDRNAIVEFNEILLKACAKDSAQRYQTAEELRADLELLQRGKSVKQKHSWQLRLKFTKKLAAAFALAGGLIFAASSFVWNHSTHRLASSKPAGLVFETSGTKSLGAYGAYRKGRFFWNKRTREGLTNALACFEQAIALDPNFARAHAGLADCYNLFFSSGVASKADSVPKAGAAARHALALDDSLAEAHAALAFFKQYYEWDWPGAEWEFNRAIQLNPSYAMAHKWYAYFLAQMRRFPEALNEAKRALDLEPESLIMNSDYGLTLFLAGRANQAIEQYRRTIAMDALFPIAHKDLADVLYAAGRTQEAIAEWEKAGQLAGETEATRAALRAAYERDGLPSYWRELVRRTQESNYAVENSYYYSQALIYLRLGEKTRALDCLEQSLARQESWLIFANARPEFDPLRTEPRFQKILRTLKLKP